MRVTQQELEEKEAELYLRGSWDMSWNPHFGLYNPGLSFRSGYIPTQEIDEANKEMDEAAVGGECDEEEAA
jgi:hypothetical protein